MEGNEEEEREEEEEEEEVEEEEAVAPVQREFVLVRSGELLPSSSFEERELEEEEENESCADSHAWRRLGSLGAAAFATAISIPRKRVVVAVVAIVFKVELAEGGNSSAGEHSLVPGESIRDISVAGQALIAVVDPWVGGSVVVVGGPEIGSTTGTNDEVDGSTGSEADELRKNSDGIGIVMVEGWDQ